MTDARSSIRERLLRLDACAISDALDQLGLAASVTGLRPLAAPVRISGRVVTVRLAAGKPSEAGPVRHLCAAAIDQADAGDVIVVEHTSGVECAGWGGILSNAARIKRLSGVIVDGFARDVDEARDAGFAVYARGTTARTARGRVYEVATAAPVEIGGVSVCSGDYVVADGSGAAFIPAAKIGDVLESAEAIAAKEAAMTKAVLNGGRVSEIMGGDYEHMLERRDGDE